MWDHTCFRALSEAFKSFTSDDPLRRIVVFVDDLDRCLPRGALDVIESMKLFFDLKGFVFVVGLDEKVVETFVELRYRDLNVGSGTEARSKVRGAEYIKKIFQVPFALAPVSVRELPAFIESAIKEAGLSAQQASELRTTVLPHLDYIVTDTGVNPRDIKRYINAFTLVRKIKPNLGQNTTLALQTMSFRIDWQPVYRSLLAYRNFFIRALRDQVGGQADALRNLDEDIAAIPPDFMSYVASGSPGHELIDTVDIDEHIYAGEATRSAGSPLFVDAIPELTKLRGLLRTELPEEVREPQSRTISDMSSGLGKVQGMLRSLSEGPIADATRTDLTRLQKMLDDLTSRIKGAASTTPVLPAWRQEFDERLKGIITRLISTRASAFPASA
jgi:hypothetical protein